MKSSVHIEESNSTKLSNLLQLLLRKFTPAVTRIEKAEGSKQYEKKISLATIAPGSLFSILIIVLLILNGWLVAGSRDNLYGGQLALGFLGIANIVFLAVSARSNASAVAAQNDRPSSQPDGCDRFFSLSPDMLCVIGFDGYVTLINPAAEKILGYSPAEMIGKLFIEFVHPDDREITLKEVESIAAGNNTVGFENRWRCRNGSYKWIAWTATRFCEEELIYGVGRDITDRQRAQESLQYSNSILYSVIESTPDIICVKDIQGRYTIANSALAQFFEKPLEAILGTDDAGLFPAEMASKIIEIDSRVTAGEYLTYEEYIPKNGAVQTFLTAKYPWRDSQENIIGVVGISRDISDRIRAEKALQESEERYRCLIEATSQIVWDTKAAGEFVTEQTGWSAFTGQTYGELKGWGWLNAIHPDDRQHTAKIWSDAIANCTLYEVEHRLRRHDGEYRYMSVRGVPVLNADGSVRQWVGAHFDITDRKITEEQIQQQKEFLRSIYDGVDYSIFVIDVGEDGEFRYAGWNPATDLLGGISSEFGYGKTPQELFPEATAAMFRQNLIDCLEKGSSISREYPANFVPGEIWSILTLTPLQDPSGKIYRVVGSFTDITERKKAETQLREQEEFLNSIYNGSSQALFVIDVGADGEFRYAGWNTATEAYTGLLSADIKGKTPEEVFPPTVAADFRQRCVDCLAADSSISYEDSTELEGAQHWFMVTLTALRDASGRIYRLIGNSTNITDRKQAEAALQESQRFVERIANTSPNLLFVYDESEQRNVYSNREISDTLGYTRAEVENMGSNLLPTIIHPDDLAKFPGYFQQLENAPDGEVIEYEYRVRDRQNCLHWLVSRNIVFSRTEEGKIKQRLGAATDITQRKIAEQALAEQLKLSLFTADVGIALTQNQTLLATLQYCADAVVRHLDAAFARIWTLNEEGNVLELQASAGIYTHIDGAHSRIAVGEFKIGLIALERKPHITNSVQEDPRVQDKEWTKREGMVAFAGYPLIVDNQLLGVMAMFARQELNESTLVALASSADAIALGIKRKQTEEALAIQKQTLRAIIDNAPIWVWLTDTKGKMLLVNKTFCESVNVPEERFLAASHSSEILGGEAFAKCMASDVQVWSQDTPFYADEIIQFADGENHHLEVIKAKVKEANGSAIGLIGLGLDVTQQKEAQRKLQASEARFRKLAEQEALLNQLASNIRESLDLGTILATTVQQIRDLLQLDRCMFIWYLPDASPPAWDVVHEAKNDDLFSLLGYFPADITGTQSQKIANLEVYPIDDVATLSDPVERKFFLEVGYKSVLDLPIKSAEGLTGVICCVSCSEMRKWTKEEVELMEAIGAQLGIAISQSELYTKSVDSARIAQEQAAQLEVTLCELQQAQTQLVQAEKMSSLGQMVAGIAHEINNPISFIFGNLTYTEEYTTNLMKLVQMYRDEYPEPSPDIQQAIEVLELDFVLDDLPKMLSSMQVGATRIRDIVRSLRNFSRLDESDMKKVNIHEGIDSTLMILEHRLKVQPVSVEGTEYRRPAIQLVKEYGQLPLVECYAGLLNQVFMNIIANAIDVLQQPLENPGIIRIRTAVEGTLAVIRIADNGAGITDQVKQRIFDPFYTTKPIGSGTGMGLAISHSIIVEKHKGEIKCFSLVGKGSEFIIEIPIKRTEN
ncbi:PAS domain S-box protein [Microcoleus asticus]|uniref:histidine kinase n=1 Tax=Microcoleus asticus IPMA8 TaxID=2563858 RepID=A0ABX2CVK3_9CYAN|nr:PAS domain S-box protein [Microcoleus asticus]NQE34435.1 Sensor protein ZraS [Microcoleus asticus IPMA8]